MTNDEWDALMAWADEELQFKAFRLNFMTPQEMARELGPPAAGFEHRLDDENEKKLRDRLAQYQEKQKAQLEAFAEKLACNFHMAAYLRGLNEKLDVVADAFSTWKVFKE